ncbi:Clavaminate synthase-like protein [Melanomma pulvis-pyrius CBS 109.77]|uniref:Clavaminate synthase-like protein n=1 Tax=Melanomma pulvis-pyrius CBS 109.77 TaxID=1314802 RepID=A0A6A6XUU8_9PLEO|nr:Clavaminate synthase-like protein [Melanomma pulvis-pyrius CBS 109.77]
MRHVSLNQPFVVRGYAASWPASQTWSASYLSQTLGSHPVNVAITPFGNADSVIDVEDEGCVFVQPYEATEPFCDALKKIQHQELHSSPQHRKREGEKDEDKTQTPTRYLQTQNDNLRSEYLPLFTSIPPSIPFAHIALQKPPDAINFWLGNSHSVTALHKDNYENIYVQVRGQKHFVLLPPVESVCVNERSVLAATYGPRDGGENGNEDLTDLVPHIDTPTSYTPFALWDPEFPTLRSARFSHLSRPLRVTLDEGDMLYLPALWYHKVSQSCSEEGICCAVNYWYDLDFGGSFWAMAGFVRGVGLLSLGGRGGDEEVEEKEQEEEGEGKTIGD